MAEKKGFAARSLDAAMGAMSRVMRGDSWRNTVTNTGTNYGKTATRFTPGLADYLDDETLGRLYELDGMAARIVDAVPKHAMRHPPRFACADTAVTAAVNARLEDLGAWAAMQEAWAWARLYGGAAVVVGADDGRETQLPIDMKGLRAVRFLVTADRRDLQPRHWYENKADRQYGTPSVYSLLRQGGVSSDYAPVHATRVLRFPGVPTTKRRRQELQGWDDSVLQRVHVELQAVRSAFAGAGNLIQEASVVTVGVKGLMGLMASDPTDILKTRFDVMQRMFGIGRWLMHDADGETVSRLEVGALTGVVDVMDRFVNFLSAVSGIPVTVLMGQAPAGLNATGEADMENWYDEVGAERTRVLQPRAEQLVRMLLRSSDGPTKGIEPEGWRLDMPPLRQATAAQKSDERAKQATTDAIYIDKGVLTPEEVALSRFAADGWSAETIVDLDARRAAMESGGEGSGEDLDHDEVAAILARVAGREIPRDSGLSMLSGLGLTPERAEAVMGETGKTFFTAPDPGHAAAMDAMKGDLAKAQASLRGHQAYTARLIQRAKEGGLELGAFTAREPTDVAEGDVLEPGDVVAVPVEDSRFEVRRVDGRSDGFAVVLQLPPVYAARLPTETPAEDLHITLAFLGLNDRGDPQSIDRAVAAVRRWALTVAPIEATLGGIGRFAGGPDGEPVYVPVDSAAITDTRPALVAFLRAAGFEVAKGHGFTPHLTLAYVQPGDATPDPVAPFAVTCPTVSVWWDSVRVDIELTGGA